MFFLEGQDYSVEVTASPTWYSICRISEETGRGKGISEVDLTHSESLPRTPDRPWLWFRLLCDAAVLWLDQVHGFKQNVPFPSCCVLYLL